MIRIQSLFVNASVLLRSSLLVYKETCNSELRARVAWDRSLEKGHWRSSYFRVGWKSDTSLRKFIWI